MIKKKLFELHIPIGSQVKYGTTGFVIFLTETHISPTKCQQVVDASGRSRSIPLETNQIRDISIAAKIKNAEWNTAISVWYQDCKL